MAQGDGPILACQRQAMDYFLTHLHEWLLRAVRGLLRCAFSVSANAKADAQVL